MPAVLFVFTSANKTLTGAQTGWYLPEAAHPYYVLTSHADITIDFASPLGAHPPVDEGSVQMFAKDEGSIKFLSDKVVQEKLAAAKKLEDVNVDEYDAVFYVGGHGPVLDLADNNRVNEKLVSDFWQKGKIVSAVCHGPAGLVQGKTAEGHSIFKAQKATCFSNKEEEMVDKVKEIPFLLETRIIDLGGLYECADEPWGAKVVVSGRLITGQNPASATGVGEALLAALTASKK